MFGQECSSLAQYEQKCEAPVGFASPTVGTCGCCRCLTTTTSVCYSIVLPFGFIKQTKVFTSFHLIHCSLMNYHSRENLFFSWSREGYGMDGGVKWTYLKLLEVESEAVFT